MAAQNNSCFNDHQLTTYTVCCWTTTGICWVLVVVCLALILRMKSRCRRRRESGYSRLENNDEGLEHYIDRYKNEHEQRIKYEMEAENYRRLYTQEKDEKDDALTRLSQLVCNRLTDGNPNIANLSDTKRPTKLAEEFSELYDNAWTDAFDALETKNIEPREGIQFLLDILQTSFKWCQDKMNKQFKDLNQLLTCSTGNEKPVLEVSVDVLKHFKDERRRLATHAAKHITEEVVFELHKRYKQGKWSSMIVMPEISEYCKKCVELCWLFEVQDPPMDIQFNKGVASNFKAYTQSGTTMDYIVWPPLFLHQNGNLMNKGVAQFYKED